MKRETSQAGLYGHPHATSAWREACRTAARKQRNRAILALAAFVAFGLTVEMLARAVERVLP